MIAYEIGPSFDYGLGALTGKRFIIVGFRDFQFSCNGFIDHGAGDGMFGMAVNGSRKLEHPRLGLTGERTQTYDLWLSFGYGSGLVHGQRLEFPEGFKVLTTLHQHAPAGQGCEAGNDGNRGGNHQRTRTGNHQ